MVSYIEICGLGPSQVAGAVGFGGGLYDSAIVRVYPTGMVRVYIGGKPHGQGEETTFAQIVAEEFGYPVENIEIVARRYRDHAPGMGHLRQPHHRGLRIGGQGGGAAGEGEGEEDRRAPAWRRTSRTWSGRTASSAVRGSPDQAKTLRRGGAHGQRRLEHAGRAWSRASKPRPSSIPTNFVYPFGTHICTVEVDAETGEVKILRYIAVDDCGPHINPMIVEGQIHGGVIQGIGEALQEIAVYDESGQLLTGTMMDYAVPKASQMPRIETDHTVTPSPVNPLGVKGWARRERSRRRRAW